jgi:hypothetical protein
MLIQLMYTYIMYLVNFQRLPFEIHLKSHFAPLYFLSGPNKHTIKDFWQMVWQEKVNIIVMVTKLEEERRVT